MNKTLAQERLKEMEGCKFLKNGKEIMVISAIVSGGNIAIITTSKETYKYTLGDLPASLATFQPIKRTPIITRPAPEPETETKKKANTKTPEAMGLPPIDAAVQIKVTNLYNVFKNITGNRELNMNKIKRIEKDIASGLNMLPYCPIIVDEEMNIIDGQHRFFIARKLKQYIHYIVAPELSLHEIARVNSNTERWKGKDFIHCYATQGNENYIKLQAFMDKYHLPHSTAMTLLATGGAQEGSSRLKEVFETGKFMVLQEKKAEELMQLALCFKNHPGFLTRQFLAALATIKAANKCDWNILLKKFDSNPELLPECANKKDYLLSLEQVYNKGAQQRKILY